MNAQFLNRALAILMVTSATICTAAEAVKPAELPTGSLVIRGPKRAEATAAAGYKPGTNSPEHHFGLRIEEAIRTNDLAYIWQAFDVDAFYRRSVESLPASEETKDRFYAAAHQNREARQAMANELLSDVKGLPHTRFLGTRMLADDCALLFRDADGTGAAFEVVSPMYIAYVVGRQADGSFRIVDAHRFRTGQMMSRKMRRMMFMELVKKKMLVGERMSVEDRQRVASIETLELFDSRCDYGKFSLIKDAYDRLPAELQDNREILFSYAGIGERSIKDLMVPVERWRRVYPSDPTPDLLVVNFYWDLYQWPRTVNSGPNYGVYTGQGWAPADPALMEQALEAAIERANAWFADPRMEVRMAVYYGPRRPEKARPLLQKALKRFPAEAITFEELLKVDLASGNFDGVADTLRLDEAAFRTNLTQMVNVSKDYERFRKSPAYNQWQDNSHAADGKNLAAASRASDTHKP